MRIKRRDFLKMVTGAGSTLTFLQFSAFPNLAQGASRRKLRLGASLNLSGSFADEGIRQSLAYKLWIEQMNTHGGLLSQQMELILYDDQYDTTRAARNYQRLIYKDKVDLLLGPFGSIPSIGAVPVIEEAQIPCVIPMASNPRIWAPGRKWCVQLIPPAPTFMHGVVHLLHEAGIKTLAILYINTGIATDVAHGFRDKAGELGLEVVFFARYPAGKEEPQVVEALAQQVKTLNPEVVGIIRQASGVGEIIDVVRKTGLHPKLFAWMEIDEAEWLEVNRDDVAYMIGSGFWLPNMRFPGSQTFVQELLERWGKGLTPEEVAAFLDHHPPAGYAACQLTRQAVETVGSLDLPAIRDVLFHLKTETVFGRYQVDEKGKQIGKLNAVLQWQEGKREVVWPVHLRTAELRYPALAS